jgi:hypothetical protein
MKNDFDDKFSNGSRKYKLPELLNNLKQYSKIIDFEYKLNMEDFGIDNVIISDAANQLGDDEHLS